MNNSNRELVFERLLKAPQDLAFEAWTTPEHLANWWGPDGFTLTTSAIEAKPGGIWKFIMHGPDGTDYRNKIMFLEVERPDRLVYKHLDDEDTEGISFLVTVTFEKQDDKTKLTMRMLFNSAEELERVAREYGAIEGAEQTLGRLEVLLKELSM